MESQVSEVASYMGKWAKKRTGRAKKKSTASVPNFRFANTDMYSFLSLISHVNTSSLIGKTIMEFFDRFGIPLPTYEYMEEEIKAIRVKRGYLGRVHFLTNTGWIILNSRGTLFKCSVSEEETQRWFNKDQRQKRNEEE